MHVAGRPKVQQQWPAPLPSVNSVELASAMVTVAIDTTEISIFGSKYVLTCALHFILGDQATMAVLLEAFQQNLDPRLSPATGRSIPSSLAFVILMNEFSEATVTSSSKHNLPSSCLTNCDTSVFFCDGLDVLVCFCLLLHTTGPPIEDT